jgi:hypothetical protein
VFESLAFIIVNLVLINLGLSLEVIFPVRAKEAEDAQKLVFHTLGDVGGIHGDEVQ